MTEDLHSLAAAYALNALDTDERAEFEAHLSTCTDCARDVAEFGAVATSLAETSAAVPPPQLKAAVMSQLDDLQQEPPAVRPEPLTAPLVDLAERRRRKLSMPNLLAVAAAVALIAIGAVVISANRGSSAYDEVVGAPDAVVTQLDGASGTIQVVYSDDLDQVAVRGSGLDDLEPGLRYALWAIADGTPIPAGLFEPGDGDIEYVTELADVSADAWGVTIEPATGSDQPTTEIILYAEV